MKQIILKNTNHTTFLGSSLALSLFGDGNSSLYNNPANGFTLHSARAVMPVGGVFRNLLCYSPIGSHQNHTVTLRVNNVATALACSLSDTQTKSTVNTTPVTVIAGDDVYFHIATSPHVSRLNDTMAICVQFEGDQQFFCINSNNNVQVAGMAGHRFGGALGNGFIQQAISPLPDQYGSSRSICSVPGTLTGLRMKTFATAPSVGGSYTAYLSKNLVLQDGTGGTVNTACNLVDGIIQAFNTFSLPIAIGDHVAFVLVRNITNSVHSFVNVVISCSFTPTNDTHFMCTGGSNDANNSGDDWRWCRSPEGTGITVTTEEKAQVQIGPVDFTLTGLHIECPQVVPVSGAGRKFTIRKNGVDTAATVTVPSLGTSGSITGLAVPFTENDLIDLMTSPVNGGVTANGLWWGLSMAVPDLASNSGIYFINPTKPERHDTYRTDEKKIPGPLIRTALLGE